MGLALCQLDFEWPGTADGQPPLLRSVEAHFPSGSVTLISGATGAGKSTLLHLLAGLLRPTAGEVRADGQPVSRWPSRHLDPWRRQVGIVFQHLGLMADLTAAENLLMALIPRKMGWSAMQKAVRHCLARVDLLRQAAMPVHALSGGQRQRLAIARAMMSRPRYVLADEPTAFQDDHQTAHICALMNKAARRGAVVVICSHDSRLRGTCAIDHRLHLASGRLTPLDPIQAES